jgi:GH25 family lysozyme M1 (1,4-beta-N-acetylmuramidase)
MKKLAGILAVCLLALIGSQSHALAQTFIKGDIVEVYNTGGVGLKVRDTPCGNRIGNKSDGSIGLVLEGPRYCVLEGTGYYWWRIRWSDGMEGWSAQNWLRRVSLPSITSASSSPSTISPGGTVTLTYNVTNPGKEIGAAIAPLLGASIQLSGGGPVLSDPANDRKTTIRPGSSSVSRPFVVPSTASPGTYDLLVSLVADVNNNGRIDSDDRAWDLKRFSGALQVRVPCIYSISPISQSFGSAGGSGSVSVTAASGCPWTATSNASWITITSGSSGNGNGTVSYSVATNLSTSSRTGTMTIAGQTFTVNQTGTTIYTLTVNKTGTGNGTVTGPGINCGSDCQETYPSGTSVTLTATAASGSTFAGWSGACSGTGSCTIIMNANKSVTATFNEAPPILEVTPNSLSFGDVTVGQCSSNQSFTVRNAGGGTLNGSASTSVPFNIVSGSSFSLGANQSAQVTVRFCPATAGSVNGNVNFTSNSGNISRSVSGNGVTQPPTKVKGIDVSHWQGNIDWTQVYKAGYVFAFVKATEGDGLLDPKFITNITNAKNAGVIVGPYHFARPDLGNTAIAEADYFVSKAGDYIKSGYLRPALDIECDPVPPCANMPSKTTLVKWVHDWMNRVKDKTGVEPIIYTGPSFSRTYLNSSVAVYNIWISHWTYDPDNTSPDTGIWSGWDFWQYSNKGSVPGIDGDVDLNVFNGDLSRLNTFVITGAPTTVCPGVTVTSSPSSVTYTKKNQTKYIYVTITNNSGASRRITAIAKQSDEPFTIKSISPSLPYTIRNGSSRTFSIRTQGPGSGLPVTATSPYFNITLDCGTLSAASVPMMPMPEQQLRVTDLRAMALGQELVFAAVGDGIASLQVELFDLSGRKVFDSGEVQGNTFIWNLQNNAGRWLANGVYLYVVRVRGFNGELYVSEVKKLVVLR